MAGLAGPAAWAYDCHYALNCARLALDNAHGSLYSHFRMNDLDIEHVLRTALTAQGRGAFDTQSVALLVADPLPRIERGLVVRILAGYLATLSCSSVAAAERLVAWLRLHPEFEVIMFDAVHDALLFAGLAAHLSRASYEIQLRSLSQIRQPLLQRVRNDVFCHAVEHALHEFANGIDETRYANLLYNRDSFLSCRT